ncbi:ester cyclase [Xanthomonas sp. AM6]|uniref:ester cyclase n=1 Tax=Xanthomonas sp. AM6 TaxID=2982531 RepID=UPI0021D83C0E|nr:ester cyclase [Xanthomonas sp. AM6]UYB54267.1 ester cyclase [Xanthomonas sp. AM6]
MADLDANKAVVLRYFDAFNRGDLAHLGDIVTADYGDRLEGQTAGIGVIRSYLQGLKASFPDFTWTIEQIIAEGDRVAVMNRVSGTHLGDFGGLAATGNRVDFRAFQIYRIQDGKLAEHWEVADFAAFQAQLGVAPEASAFHNFQKTLKSDSDTKEPTP